MGRRFLDLHVHSTLSTGRDPREELERHARSIGVEIRFCDASQRDDGVEVSFRDKAVLKQVRRGAAYLVLEPLTSQAFQSACRAEHAIIRAPLSYARARMMARGGSAAELCLSVLFNVRGMRRVRAVKSLRRNIYHARKQGVPMVATTGASSIYGLRSPYQAFELLKALGLRDDEASQALYENPLAVLEG